MAPDAASFRCRGWVFLSLAAFLGGCASPESALARKRDDLGRQWAEISAGDKTVAEKTFTWEEAIDRLLHENLPVKRAIASRHAAERAKQRVFRRFIPMANLRAGVSEQAANLRHDPWRNLSVELNTFSYFEGIFTVNRDYYAAELGQVRAIALEEIVRREQVAALYLIFAETRECQRLALLAERLRPLVSQFCLQAPQAPLALKWRQFEERLALLAQRQRTSAAHLLQYYDGPIRLDGGGAPGFNYGTTHFSIKNPAQIGELHRQIVAIELVAAEAQLRGARLEYWPDLSAYISSGPVFSSNGGKSFWWSTERVAVSAGIQIPIDLNGAIGNRVTEAKAALAAVRDEARKRQRALLEACRDRQGQLDELQYQMAVLEERIHLAERFTRIATPVELPARLINWLELQTMLTERRLKEAEQNAFLVCLDESFWRTPRKGPVRS